VEPKQLDQLLDSFVEGLLRLESQGGDLVEIDDEAAKIRIGKYGVSYGKIHVFLDFFGNNVNINKYLYLQVVLIGIDNLFL
ncbi:MAG: hypothetical protein ACFFD4_22190, partial [Candidatus Odinarchaeota archaeon]